MAKPTDADRADARTEQEETDPVGRERTALATLVQMMLRLAECLGDIPATDDRRNDDTRRIIRGAAAALTVASETTA